MANTYERQENVKKSIYDFIEGNIPEYTNSNYIVGDGSSNLAFYFNFPEGADLVTFRLPSISLDLSTDDYYTQYDLGSEAEYSYRYVIDIFARSGRERDYLGGVIKKMMYESIPYNDYNVGDGSCVGYVHNDAITAYPIRMETIGEEQNFRFAVSFTSKVVDDYE